MPTFRPFSLSLSWTCEIRREHAYLTVAKGSHETLNLEFRGYTRLTPSLEVEILDDDNDIKIERRLPGGAAVLTLSATVLTLSATVLTAGDTVLIIQAGVHTAGEIVLPGDETIRAAAENRLNAHVIVFTVNETIDAASETVVSRRTNADSFYDGADCRCEKRRQFSDNARAC